MDLWIRSQDKRQLLKVNDGLFIANGFTDTDDTFIGIKNVGHVGKYTKEKRALEVLDEINNAILGIICLGDVEAQKVKNYTGNATLSTKTNNIIYEMPKDDE